MKSTLQFLFIFFSCVFYIQASTLVQGMDDPRQLIVKAKALVYTQPAEAVRLSEKALSMANGNSSIQMTSLIIAASAYAEKSDSDMAIKRLLQAKKIVDDKKDFINQIRILGLLGYQYQSMQMNEKARFYLDTAEQMSRLHSLPDSLQYLKGNIYSIKALSYRDDLDCNFANKYFNKAIGIYKASKNKSLSTTNLSVTYIHKGYCFIEMQQLDSAVYVFRQAEDLIRKNNLQRDILVMQKTGLANVYFLRKDYSGSIRILDEALEISKELSQIDLHTEIYKLLSENYLQVNDLKNYRHFNKLYTADLERMSESEKKSMDRTVYFQYNENENQLKNTMSQSVVYICIGIGVIVFLIGMYLLKSYRMNKKIKKFRDI